MKSTRRGSHSSPRKGKPSTVSFMPRSQRVRVDTDSSDEGADEGAVERGDDSDEDDDVPVQRLPPLPTSSQSVSTRLKRAVISDDDEEDEDGIPVAPSSSRRRRPAVIELDTDSESDVSPAKKRKTVHQSQVSSGASKSSTEQPTGRRLIRKGQPSSSPTKRHRGHRTEKQKNMELLKRRRAGEKINQLTSSDSELGDDKKGLYDTDSDDALQVLEEFPDDEEGESEVPEEVVAEDEDEDDDDEPAPSRKSKKVRPSSFISKPKDRDSAGSDESDLDDFVVEDDDAPIGVPTNMNIPIEFTAQARKPLKEQFPHVVEWLVHNKVNPAFDRKADIYTYAWRKLDDEVRGLASSKFVSAVWKVEFYRSLKARPKLEAFEMGKVDLDLYDTCEACGRSGHPATWKIVFQGRPYLKDTLDEIESDSEDSDADSDASGHESVDTQGNSLPPVSREWSVGSTCSSNAETAHSLLHWKYHLKEWVQDRLELDGHMKAAKLKEREKMKPKKRRQAANDIVDKWQEDGVITSLYNDFRAVLQEARNKSTSGRGGPKWK
ncbi:hypothetical protein AB5N19_04367 [Seiridium cardinale]|uniref:DUF4211 domain-containing protein n=1 Tax=Seiridium cardinale TaxID=138064 RepID=A0ABR2Y8R5_9PEZI